MRSVVLLLLITSLLCDGRVDILGYGRYTLVCKNLMHSCVYVSDQSNEGNEFYVGFFQNRFGSPDEPVTIPPILWVTTSEMTPVSFNVTMITETLYTGFASHGQITYVPTNVGVIVSNSTQTSEQFKGIHIKAEDGRKILVFGQHEELASNDAFLALPVISLPPGRNHEYVLASVHGNNDASESDSVALIVGTENNTRVTVIPSASAGNIEHGLALLGHFFEIFDVSSVNTITINQHQTVCLQVRNRDISGTRIVADKPISVFSGHECAIIPINSCPCDMVIEQLPPVDTWGTTIVTIPLRTRSGGDLVKVIAAYDFTTVNITQTDLNNSTVINFSIFTLNAGQYREILISNYTLMQSDRPIEVFQFSRSWLTDSVRVSDPFMIYVPPVEQYRNSYAVATAPFDPSLNGTADNPLRGPYTNYTNIVVPAEYFNLSLLTINNRMAVSSDFLGIRNSNGTIWGYGAQLLLDAGAQVISHQNAEAGLGITLYGFSNQMSWGCVGGMGLAPVAGTVTWYTEYMHIYVFIVWYA